MSFQRRGCGIHFVSAEPKPGRGEESAATEVVRKRRNTKGHTPGSVPPTYTRVLARRSGKLNGVVPHRGILDRYDRNLPGLRPGRLRS